MQACLTKDPQQRPSAEQLLQHEWLVGLIEAEAKGIPEASHTHCSGCLLIVLLVVLMFMPSDIKLLVLPRPLLLLLPLLLLPPLQLVKIDAWTW